MNEGKSIGEVINPLKKVTGSCPKCGFDIYISVPNDQGVDFKYAKLKWTEERAEVLRDKTLGAIERIQEMITKLNEIKMEIQLLNDEPCR